MKFTLLLPLLWLAAVAAVADHLSRQVSVAEQLESDGPDGDDGDLEIFTAMRRMAGYGDDPKKEAAEAEETEDVEEKAEEEAEKSGDLVEGADSTDAGKSLTERLASFCGKAEELGSKLIDGAATSAVVAADAAEFVALKAAKGAMFVGGKTKKAAKYVGAKMARGLQVTSAHWDRFETWFINNVNDIISEKERCHLSGNPGNCQTCITATSTFGKNPCAWCVLDEFATTAGFCAKSAAVCHKVQKKVSTIVGMGKMAATAPAGSFKLQVADLKPFLYDVKVSSSRRGNTLVMDKDQWTKMEDGGVDGGDRAPLEETASILSVNTTDKSIILKGPLAKTHSKGSVVGLANVRALKHSRFVTQNTAWKCPNVPQARVRSCRIGCDSRCDIKLDPVTQKPVTAKCEVIPDSDSRPGDGLVSCNERCIMQTEKRLGQVMREERVQQNSHFTAMVVNDCVRGCGDRKVGLLDTVQSEGVYGIDLDDGKISNADTEFEEVVTSGEQCHEHCQDTILGPTGLYQYEQLVVQAIMEGNFKEKAQFLAAKRSELHVSAYQHKQILDKYLPKPASKPGLMSRIFRWGKKDGEEDN